MHSFVNATWELIKKNPMIKKQKVINMRYIERILSNLLICQFRKNKNKKNYFVKSKASTQEPLVEALEYSVALPSKKFMCSTPFNISSNHVSGFSFTS